MKAALTHAINHKASPAVPTTPEPIADTSRALYLL